MSMWSDSMYSEVETARSDVPRRNFLDEIDACLYEGVPTHDPKINEECKLWRSRFPHLRILGKKIERHPRPPNTQRLSAKQATRPDALNRPKMTADVKKTTFPNNKKFH